MGARAFHNIIMKSITSLLTLALCVTAATVSAQDDPVVMRINGQDVTRSEFEYNYNKNNTDDVIDKKTVSEYADLFINYKLKVCAALDAKLDTLSSYQQEFRTYRDQQIRPLLVLPEAEEAEARDYYMTVTEMAAYEGLSGVKRFRPYIPLEHVYGYTWPNENNNSWPGAELLPDAEGWYSYIVTKGNNVIFNNGTGERAMQTGNLAYTDEDPIADECAVWQGETSVWESTTYMTTLEDCNAAIALKYERNITSGNYGTICLPYSAIKVEGAELFSITGRDESSILLEETNELLMGVPYIFLASADQMKVYYWGGQTFTPSANDLYTANGLVGFIHDGQTYTIPHNETNYILYNNGLYYVDSENVNIASNRAYIDWSGVPVAGMSSAPLRRISVHNMPTDIVNAQGDNMQCKKTFRDGQIVIVRNGKTYNAHGQIIE